MQDVYQFGKHTVTNLYGRVKPMHAQKIIDFWRRNGALPAGAAAAERVHQVVCVAENAAGEVVGVNTVYRAPFGPQQEPYFAYRMFIQPADRVPGMMRFMTVKAYEILKDCEMDNKPAGIVIVTENEKLMRPGMRALLGRIGYEPVGTDHRGLDVWRQRF